MNVNTPHLLRLSEGYSKNNKHKPGCNSKGSDLSITTQTSSIRTRECLGARFEEKSNIPHQL